LKNKGKTLTIGYINTVFNQEWALYPWKGAVSKAKENNVNLMTFCGNAIKSKNLYKEQGNSIYDLAKESILDGLISWKGHITEFLNDLEISEFLESFKIPVVLLEGYHKGYTSIKFDCYNNMKMAIGHLIGIHGYKRIGYLGIVADHSGFVERFEGYKDILKEKNISYDETIVKPWNQWNSLAPGNNINVVLDEWLIECVHSGVQAIAASCDPTAVWLIDHLEKLGIKVPDDISVVGHDGFIFGTASAPRLTTVKPDWIDMGKLAVETILKLINGDKVPELIYANSELIISQSCGCLENNVKHAGFQSMISENGSQYDSNIRNKISDKNHEDHIILLELLKEDVAEENSNRFISKLNDFLKEELKKENEIIKWQDIISLIQNKIKILFKETSSIEKANSLCNQARVLINNSEISFRSNILINVDEYISLEHDIVKNLASTFDINKIIDILAEKLPKLSIKSCFLNIYEDPKTYNYPDRVSEWSRLIMAFNENGRIDLETGGVKFKTHDIFPADLNSMNKAGNYLLFPLYFEKYQIGFIVFEIINNLQIGNTFNILANQISVGLKGVFLINDIMEKDKMLENAIRDIKSNHEILEKTYNKLKENQEMLLVSEKIASLGRLTAGIAHEMNTPLSASLYSLSILTNLIHEYQISINDPQVLPEDHKEISMEMLKHADIAMKSVDKSLGFIRGIKSYNISMTQENNQKFKIAPILKDSFTLLDFILNKNKCKLITEIDNELILYGNPRFINQIITNLIINSIDACKPSGGNIFVYLYAENGNVILEVKDTGSGIAKENISKIFDLLFTTKPFGEGTGLGLNIVNDLVSQLKGTITVNSEPGNTVFMITFPGVDTH
jgi:signal transduction histidine kinase/DNA-binding LacI/PurR family transcriptional regulator